MMLCTRHKVMKWYDEWARAGWGLQAGGAGGFLVMGYGLCGVGGGSRR